jgi:hypothetical protein
MNIIFDKNFPLKNSGEFGFFPCIPMFENLRPLDRFFQMKNFARSYRPRFGVDFLAPENSRSDQVFSRFYLQSKAEFGFIPLHPIPFFSGGGLISFSNKDFDLSLLFNNFGSGKLFLGNYKRKINSAVFPFDQIGVVLKSCAFNEAGLAHFDNFKKRFIKYSFNSFKKTRYAYQFNAATPFNLSRRIVDKFRRRYFFAVRGYLLERSS